MVAIEAAYFLLATFLFAQDGGLPGTLLNYGMSPRTIAMGEAFTGLANDQEAIYYNPAGLIQLLSHNMKASHIDLYGHRLEYLGYAMPTRRFGSLGISIINFAAQEIDSRDEYMNPVGTYNFAQNCIFFSYAFQPAKIIGLGTNMKLVTSKIAQHGAVGMGGDFGLFILPREDYTFGISCQNILGPKLTHYQETEEFPMTFRFGGAAKLYQGRAIIAADIVKNILEYTSVEYHLGVEFIPLYPFVTLRAGLDRNFVGTGAGLRKDWGNMSMGVDYAIEFHYASSYLLPYRHKFGIFLDFGGFRTWVEASPKRFSPKPGRKENVAWLDLHYTTRKEIKRWQLLIKNQYSEVVRTYSGWDAPPLRLVWDGLDDAGRLVSDGRYYYEIVIIDKGGEKINFSDFLTNVVTLGPEGEIQFVPQE